MSWKKTLAAALVLAVLGILYYLDAERGKNEIREQAAAERLFDVPAESIGKIQIEPVREAAGAPEGEAFTLERVDGRWAITAPIATGIEPATAEAIVGRVQGEAIERVFEQPEKLADYGLDPPRLLVRWWQEGAEQPSIRIGDASPTRSMVFAQVDGRPQVYGLESGVLYDLARKVDDIRDRRVLDFEPDAVRRIEIQRGDEALVLARPAGQWQLEEPVAAPADAARVDSFLRSLKALRVKQFVDDQPARPDIFDLEPPLMRVAVLTGDDLARHELQLGTDTPTDGVFARSAGTPTVFAVYKEYIGDITPQAADLRDRTVLRFDRDQVAGLEIQGSHGPIRLERAGEDWRMTVPEERPADRGAVSGILSSLEYMAAEGFPERAELGGELPPAAVAVTLSTAEEPARRWTLNLAPVPGGPEPPAGALAWSEPEGPYFRVGRAEIGRVDPAPFQMGDRLLLDLKRDQAKSVSIEHGGRRLALARRGEAWKVEAPDDAGLDDKAVEDILWALDYVELDRPPEAGVDPAAAGLDPPRFTVTATSGDGERQVLHFGNEAPDGGLYAASGDRSRFGLIERAKARDLLDSPFFAAAAPAAPAP